jgi:hypothetical protein
MSTMSRRTRLTRVSIAVIGGAVVVVLLWSSRGERQNPNGLRVDRRKIEGDGSGVASPSNNAMPDFYRLKYGLEQRAEFHVSSSQPMAMFVEATGVQVRTDSGWKPFSEEPRNEIWRLKPGVARELFVERPPRETRQTWRAYVRYGTEMNGPSLWRVQLREARKIRSFSNWTGKPWGGGHFSGENELFTEEVGE